MSLIIPKGEMIVRKSEALLTARYQLGELALKLISIIYSNVKRSDEVNKRYELKISDIAKIMNKNYGEIYNLLDEATNEMLENPLKIVIGEDEKGKKEWEKFNWISYAKYKEGVITFSISPDLKPYILELQKKFVKYRLENILNLKGVYVIRLYEILKDIFNHKTRNHKKPEKIYTLLEFREMLEIPKSYPYGGTSGIKTRMIEKAKKEFAENTDILFNYEEIKTGRKVTHIRFFIYKNPKNYKEETSNKNKEIEAPKETKSTNKWNNWRKELIKQGDIIILLEDKIFKLKNGYLFENDKLLSSEKSFKIWQKLYENKDELQIINENEYIQEQIKKVQEQESRYKKIDELKNKYKYLIVKINEENKEVSLTDIQYEDNIFKLFMSIFGDSQTVYKIFESLDKLEEFLKVCYDSYLRNKGKI